MSYTPTPLNVLLPLGRALTGAVGFTLALGTPPAGGADAVINSAAPKPVVSAAADARLFVGAQRVAPWRQLKPAHAQVALAWAQTAAVQTALYAAWQTATPQQQSYAVPWIELRALQTQSTAPWRLLAARAATALLPWGATAPLQTQSTAPWRGVLPQHSTQATLPWQAANYWQLQAALPWSALQALQLAATLPWQAGSVRDTQAAWPWDAGAAVDVYASRFKPAGPPLPTEPQPPQAADARNHACLNLHKPISSGAVLLNLGRPVQLDNCFGATLIVNNTLDVITLADNQPLEVLGINMACDVDSYAWTLDLQLPNLAAYNRLVPDSNGPKSVQITLNGYVWRFIVERVARSVQFNQPQFSAGGRSFTAYAAAPYTLPESGVNSSAALAQQLAVQALPADFNLLWQTEDWLVSEGLLRYDDKDAFSVAAQLWSAVGAVAVPSRNLKEFTIKSRYPASPWLWSTAAIDATVTEQQQLQVSAQYNAGAAWNKIYVGGTTEGALVGVRRTGTAGDFLKPQVLDPLLCATPPCVERGRVELSAGGAKAACTLLTPLNAANVAEPRLRTLLELVEVQDAATGAWRGLVTGVRVAATRTVNEPLTVVQELQLERHYG